MHVPEYRIRSLNDSPVDLGGSYVLYWMTAYRRTRWNFALDRAVEWAGRLSQSLVILETLRCDYPWASDRHHRFVLDGMANNKADLADLPVTYIPYVEPSSGDARGLVEALSAVASVVVTDDLPAFFIPRVAKSVASLATVRMEAVDSNGLIPMGLANRRFLTAASFRRFTQKQLPEDFGSFPDADPISHARISADAVVSAEIASRWPAATDALLAQGSSLAALAIDHSVRPVSVTGGSSSARVALDRFVEVALPRYQERRNQPSIAGASELSPYLRFGHISAHEVFQRVAAAENWSPVRVGEIADGRRAGWWGMSPSAEAFLDQLVTWRELGVNTCATDPAYAEYQSLPGWARDTLERHASDVRATTYTLEEFAAATTHDPLWNAAQTQLMREGRIHNYLRMLWGKKILEWTANPRDALDVMIELNNRYALDGGDPNSYSGIFWCLGRYDRPWFPERPIFGTVRYMSSDAASRKFDLSGYLEKFGATSPDRIVAVVA